MEKFNTTEFRLLELGLEGMLKEMKKYKYDIAVNKAIDVSWYIQKTETLKFLSNQIDELNSRMHELNKWMNKECREAIKQMEADGRILKEINSVKAAPMKKKKQVQKG